jgi:hypothetical protein
MGVGVAICSIAGSICISARCIPDGAGSVQRSGAAAASKHNPRLKSTLSVTPVSILVTHYFFVQSRDLDLKRRRKIFFSARFLIKTRWRGKLEESAGITRIL